MEFTYTFIQLFFWTIYLVLPLLAFLGLIVIVLGLLITRIEQWEWFDGLYWALITATTVGYGDIRPLTKIAKALSVVIAMVGLMFTGLIIAVTISTATTALDMHADEHVIETMKEKFK